MLILALALTSGFANASETHDYDCIAQTLQDYNPALYSNLKSSDIDFIMNGITDRRRGLFINVAMYCDNKARAACEDGTSSSSNPFCGLDATQAE